MEKSIGWINPKFRRALTSGWEEMKEEHTETLSVSVILSHFLNEAVETWAVI